MRVKGALKSVDFAVIKEKQEKAVSLTKEILPDFSLREEVGFGEAIQCNNAFREVRNNYSCFDRVKNKYGLYIFFNSSEILYIGIAYKQDLKTRIAQNFTAKNTGGSFRKNYQQKKNKYNFRSFKGVLKKSSVCFFTLEVKCLLHFHLFELILIALLKPIYNNFKDETVEN